MELSQFEQIKAYFGDRLEFDENAPGYDSLRNAKSQTFQYWSQNKQFDPSLENVRELEITPENMLGIESERVKSHADAIENARKIGSSLFHTDNVKVKGLELMISGSTLPIRLNLEVNGLDKTIYAKVLSEPRIYGLELYTLLGAPELQYIYQIGSEGISELAVEGSHIYDVNGNILSSDAYKESRIRLLTIAEIIGLSDLHKAENTRISRAGIVRPIDFDCLDQPYTTEEIEVEEAMLCIELGISKECLKKVKHQSKQIISGNVKRNSVKVDELLNIMNESTHSEISGHSTYIKQKIEEL